MLTIIVYPLVIMTSMPPLMVCAALLGPLLVLTGASQASAAPGDRARIGGLADVAFGSVTNLSVDQRSSQSFCVFSSSAGGGYSVTASGSGSGGSFALAAGSAEMAYDVEWADSSGRTSGTTLAANTALGGQSSVANNQNCSPSPNSSASLIIVLRAADLGRARSGNYTGTLTLLVAPN